MFFAKEGQNAQYIGCCRTGIRIVATARMVGLTKSLQKSGLSGTCGIGVTPQIESTFTDPPATSVTRCFVRIQSPFMTASSCRFLLSVCLVFACLCCRQPKEQPLAFSVPPPEQLDSIGTWLENPDHFQDTAFLEVFDNYFKQQVEAGRIDSAAHLLCLAGKSLCVNYAFDSSFVQTSIRFVEQYGQQIPSRYRTGIYLNLGDMYATVENYESSDFYFRKTLVSPGDYQTALNVAAAKSGMMYNFQNTSKLDSALLIGYEALDMFEKLGSVQGKMAVYTTLSGVYKYLSDYSEAEKLGDQARAIALQSRDSTNIYMMYKDKVALYDEMGHPELSAWSDSLYQFYKAWQPKSPSYKLDALSTYTLKLVREGKLPEAGKIVREIAPLYEVVQNDYFSDEYLYALAAYEQKLHNGIANADLYKRQLPILAEYQDFNRLILFNSVLSENALLQNDYKNAYYYGLASVAARDSLREKEIRVQVKELDKKYQTEKKEQQIALQQVKLAQKNTLIGFLLAGLAALSLAGFAWYLWRMQKQAKKESAIQQQFTRQLLENTEEERGRIARDLHDSVSHELLALKREMPDPGATKRINYIINDIRQISRNLHPVMLESIGLKLSLETLCDQYMEQGELFISHDIHYSSKLPGTAELQLFRIVQEAVSNTIKYASADACKVTLQEKGPALLLRIQDNGRGFEVEKALNSGKSFGLRSILQRSKAIGARADIRSSTQGTVIEIAIHNNII